MTDATQVIIDVTEVDGKIRLNLPAAADYSLQKYCAVLLFLVAQLSMNFGVPEAEIIAFIFNLSRKPDRPGYTTPPENI